MQLHFSYSTDQKTIKLTYDEGISEMFRSAQIICRNLLSGPTSKSHASRVTPAVLKRWLKAVAILDGLATNRSAIISAKEARDILNVLSASIVHSKMDCRFRLKLLNLCTLFAPSFVTPTSLPPLCEYADEAKISKPASDFYQELREATTICSVPTWIAILLWKELSNIEESHPDISDLVTQLDHCTKNVRLAFAILELRDHSSE